jgi:NAD(P)-dependent dehydrogenase (short-subunit alcohol dehydrogenase family)
MLRGGSRGIRVKTISPGPIDTPILDKGGLTPAQKENFIEGPRPIPLGRTGTAAKIAAAALYLAADATYATDAELFVDGGLIVSPIRGGNSFRPRCL